MLAGAIFPCVYGGTIMPPSLVDGFDYLLLLSGLPVDMCNGAQIPWSLAVPYFVCTIDLPTHFPALPPAQYKRLCVPTPLLSCVSRSSPPFL